MTTKISDASAMWNQRFADEGYLFGCEPNEYLRAKAPLLPPAGRVLCVADGEGRNSVWLARQGMKVEAFDISAVGVEKARRLAADTGVSVEFNVADCDSWNWSVGSHDAVVVVFAQFAQPAMRARLFANMVCALKPGGVLILQGYTPKQLDYKTGGPGEAQLYTADLIRESFKTLHTVELVEYEAELNEGAHHAGPSALLGFVAYKP